MSLLTHFQALYDCELLDYTVVGGMPYAGLQKREIDRYHDELEGHRMVVLNIVDNHVTAVVPAHLHEVFEVAQMLK